MRVADWSLQIPSRPAQPRIYLRDAERTAAQNGFFEQNLWANPIAAHSILQAQPAVNHFATPIAQMRQVEQQPATNGSNSTVVMSAPTSAQTQAPQFPQEMDLETPLQNAKRLISLGSISKPPSRVQEGTERIHTTHSSSASVGRRTPAQDIGHVVVQPLPNNIANQS
jgi:hypothetical protein